ncbi:MAG TPA: methyltransferase [Kofleriaceae bacterium]|nr:methyltransferase [Kofleriaceae bacterium]
MDVFGGALSAGGDFFRDAAVAAAHELGVFAALGQPRTVGDVATEIGVGARRLRRLLDVLVSFDVLARIRDRYAAAHVPERPVVPPAGWGVLANVIRSDNPLALGDTVTTQRMHEHLVSAGAPAAAELVTIIAGLAPLRRLLDLGGGAGAYTRAWLAARSDATATLVDVPDVVALARDTLAPFGDRAAFIAGDMRAVQLGESYDVALLANVLHLHDESIGAALCELAAKAIAPGGVVVVKDLRMDEGRAGPREGLVFALNMALYTPGGDVYESSRIRSWLIAAGLVDVEERRLATSPDAIVVIGRKPAEDATARELDSELSRIGKIAWRDLEAEGRLRADAHPRRLAYPAPLRRVLARAVADDSDDIADNADIRRHYTEIMPRMRVTQICGTDEPAATLMHSPLDWARLPRMSAALDRLFALLVECGVDAELPLGAASAAELRASAPTFGELYMRTHYGACMPLLYGYPADLAYFMSRGLELHATIDRYLTAPLVHELCHFGRYRDALPMHLDECVAGYLGVRVWPEFAYPQSGHDDAIYASPWLAQVGQAVVRAFGLGAVVRGHTGHSLWSAVLPSAFLDAAMRQAADDWRARRTLHFLSDTFAPGPWVELALRHATTGDDPAFDRRIVKDALRAMCLDNLQVAGSFRTRSRMPGTITIDAVARTVTTAYQSAVDPLPPSYWLPPAVAARLVANGIAAYSLELSDLGAIPEAATAICEAAKNCERAGFALVIR